MERGVAYVLGRNKNTRRKRRLIEKYKDQLENLYFYVFNKHYNQAWKINGTQMVDNIIKEATAFLHTGYQRVKHFIMCLIKKLKR